MQGGINAMYLQGYGGLIIGTINSVLVPVLFAVAFLTFLWGVYRYFILGATSETERATGREFVLWGVVAFATILSLWGIVNVFMGTIGLGVTNAPPAPLFKVGSYAPAGNSTATFPTNSSVGTSGVTPQQQSQATGAYQACQASCKGPVNGVSCGDQCQNIYSQLINGQSGSGCVDPAADNYNPSSIGYDGCAYGGTSGLKPNGKGCFASKECASGYCSGATETCQPAPGTESPTP